MIKPEKVKEHGFDPDLRRAFNSLLEYLRCVEPRTSHGAKIERTANGFFVVPTVTTQQDNNQNNSAPRWG